MTRTRINKNSLESIGFDLANESVASLENCYYYEVNNEFTLLFKLGKDKIIICLDKDVTLLERTFEFIDEITTLLEGLTGKNQFYKKEYLPNN